MPGKVRGLLLDLEGVLFIGDAAIDGAVEALSALQARGLPCRYITNTTTKPRRTIAERLAAMGFPIDPAHLFTPAAAANALLRRSGAMRVHMAAPPGLAEDFAAFELVDRGATDVDAVVMGDLYRGFDWDRLDDLFRMLRSGARLVALHKNRYCRRGEDLALDLGPFVAALEFASGKPASVMGKPSAEFFQSVLEDIGVPAQASVMVGDDIEADIGGALAAGLSAVQVMTGKYSAADNGHPTVTPTGRIGSIADLDGWLDRKSASPGGA